jgi:hypothetical protein
VARTRDLKPSFFTNEELAQLPPLARLLFQGLWCQADRDGRLEDRPTRLKVQILPYDTCDADELLGKLAAAGFIRRYEVDGRRLIQVVTFKEHQHPHPKEPGSTLPPPEARRAGERNGEPGKETATQEPAAESPEPAGKEKSCSAQLAPLPSYPSSDLTMGPLAPPRDPGATEHGAPTGSDGDDNPMFAGPPTVAESGPPLVPDTPERLLTVMQAIAARLHPEIGIWQPGRFWTSNALGFFERIPRAQWAATIRSIPGKAEAFFTPEDADGWPDSEFFDRFTALGRAPPGSSGNKRVTAPDTWPRAKSLPR